MHLGMGKYSCALLEFLEGRAESGLPVSPTPTYSQFQCKAWPTVLAQETWIDQTLVSLPQAFLGMPSEVRPGPGCVSCFISPFLPCALGSIHTNSFPEYMPSFLYIAMPLDVLFLPLKALPQPGQLNELDESILPLRLSEYK